MAHGIIGRPVGGANLPVPHQGEGKSPKDGDNAEAKCGVPGGEGGKHGSAEAGGLEAEGLDAVDQLLDMPGPQAAAGGHADA